MGFERHKKWAASCAALILAVGAPLNAAPPEPLLVTRLPDPDPYFVPPSPVPSSASNNAAEVREDAKIDDAMEDFGRALGQAAMIEQQRIEARCRAGLPPDASAEQRFEWQATCRYSRH